MQAWETADTSAAGRVREAAAHGTLSHALLLTGHGNLSELARYAAAAHECASATARPCGTCTNCRKVLRGVHPDVVTVRDEEHKFLSADTVRAARADAWTRPNEGARKVYIFPDCALLTPQDQNILLKVVEEGPPYAAFIFCAESASMALRTLRSRCVELKLQPDAAASESPMAELGADLCRRTIAGRGAVTEWAVRLESDKKKFTREALQDLLTWCRGAFAAALFLLYGREPPAEYGTVSRELARRLDRRRLLFALDRMEAYLRDCSATNVGVGHVLGALASELEDVH